ncbi:hypothetical protein NC661_00370 [Aquibacillus koreensis]|uniref:Uncharacterized protein n=1 Tax=Aquibacillus koreensis TaxID=279446 RepID=A0A9X4AI19_9BACI|nr:hypothetical protein [Aquibacillus koreensis]MCT2537392.1 hypothetical protein [Aquibacillus koreensis]MDC3418838.1 hypothetical protein [Aquibacillus koreensis]
MRIIGQVIALSIILLILSGCLYPDNKLSKNQVPNEVQLNMVQTAIDHYVERHQGLVPIRTKTSDTPIFQKYIIDFKVLKQEGLVETTPASAFENGGVYQYVLVTPEENPTVKVIDLRITDEIRSVQHRLNTYRSENIYPPFGEEIEKGVYSINYKALGLDSPPYVQSPYSQKNLPIVLDTNGDLFIDYRADLYDALQSFDHDYTNGDDIRYLLVDHYPFAPAYSLPYTIKDGEPVFVLE